MSSKEQTTYGYQASSSGGWVPVSRHEPCPKCGKTSWCRTSSDGGTLICQRVDDGSGSSRENQMGPYWVYRLGNADRVTYTTAPIVQTKPTLNHRILDYVYRTVLGVLPLSDNHKFDLFDRGLSNEEVHKRAYKTLSRRNCILIGELLTECIRVVPDEIAVEIKKFTEKCALDDLSEFLGFVPGFYRENPGEPWQLTGPEGLLVPVRNYEGRVIALKVRLDNVKAGSKYIYLSSTRYGGEGPGSPVHIPLFELDNTKTIRVTEGELKADIATILSGILTVGLPGVSGWQKAIPILKKLNPENILIAFDSDHLTNTNVAFALEQTVRGYSKEGFNVEVEKWTK